MSVPKNQPLWRRLLYAQAGLAHGLRSERSLRFHAIALILVVIALLVVRPAPEWWAMVLLASAAVMSAELFNTAVEALADHLHPDIHPSIRIVKDCAAAAVLVASAGAVGVGIAFAVHIWRTGG